MKTLNTTYAELHKLIQKNPDIKYHVKTNTGDLAPINGSICKHSDTYDIEFSNGVFLTAGDKHCFMDIKGLPIATDSLLPGQFVQTLDGTTSCIGRSNFKVNQEVYDISIDAPHWYTNDDIHGIIHHNTSFALLMAGAYLKKHKDACLMFYDSEFGSPQQYFESFGIDTNRVLHIPIKNIEELKFDIVNQLEQMERKDKVIIVIDSVGNLASKKELEDAMNEKSVADMTRAKALKGLFRMVTPYLTMKNICLLAINHTYLEIGLFPKSIVSGGTGIMYSADNVWIIGRQQDKDGTEIQGYHFVINVEKSRFVKEKSKIPISVSWEGGVQKWSGLLDVAIDGGYVRKPKNGWYQAWDIAKNVELTSNLRAAQTMTKEFWETVFKYTDFAEYIKNKYTIGLRDMMNDVEVDLDRVPESAITFEESPEEQTDD